MTTPEPTMTLAEAAAYLSVSTKTIRRLIKAGKLPAALVGRQYRLRRSDLDALFG